MHEKPRLLSASVAVLYGDQIRKKKTGDGEGSAGTAANSEMSNPKKNPERDQIEFAF